MKLTTVWEERYCVKAAHTNSTLKQAHVVRAAQDEGLLGLRPVEFNAGLTSVDIAGVHSGAYVEAVRNGAPRSLAESQGSDWSPAFAESVALIWNGHIAACRLALDRFRPELVQYQAGMDCHERDPVGGIAEIDAEFLAERNRLVIREVVGREIPLVIKLAGGYQKDGTSQRSHVQTARVAVEVMAQPDKRCSRA